MKKTFISFSFAAVCLLLNSNLFAVTVSTSSVFRARAVVSEPEISIVHTPVTKVSPVGKEIVVVGSIDVGESPNYLSDLKMIYTLPGGVETTEDISFSTNLGNVSFSKRVAFTQESGTIEYKITASAVKGVVVSTETPTYYAVISDSVTANITTAGGTVTLESGNQLYGNTSLTLPSGALSSSSDINIKEIPVESVSSISAQAASAQQVMLTAFEITPDITLNTQAVLTLYYGSKTSVQNIVVKRFDGTQWTEVSTGTYTAPAYSRASVVDSSSRTVTVDVTALGTYATFAGSGVLPDNEYRPSKRVVVYGRNEVEFNNLIDGDVIKIFNINGKKIREIRSGDASGFKWDGRKDDGGLADSGAYIYQIKLQENGKIISGTIAFVR